MKKTFALAILAAAISTSVLAQEAPYNGQPYEHPSNTSERISNVEYHSNRNSYHNSVQDKQINALEKDQIRQDQHINAVQGAAQAANEKADAGAVRMDGIEGSIRETNSSLQVTDKRSINNAVRLDGVEAHNGRQDKSIDYLNARADSINQALKNYGDTLGNHQAQIDALGSRMTAEVNAAMNEARQARKEAKEAKAGAAVALAVAGQQFCTGLECGFQTAVSLSTVGGYQALAIGAGGALTERVFVNAAVSKASNQTGAVVSGTYRW